MDEYVGIIGKIRFFWRFRCVKLRIIIEAVGLISLFSFGITLNSATILQWYDVDHIMWLNWNRYNEAFVEYLWAVLSLPCVLYFLKVNFERLVKRWQRG